MDMTSNSNSNKYPFHSTMNFDRGKMTKFYHLAPQDINSYKVVKKCETVHIKQLSSCLSITSKTTNLKHKKKKMILKFFI